MTYQNYASLVLYYIFCSFKGEKDPIKMSSILTNKKDPSKKLPCNPGK